MELKGPDQPLSGEHQHQAVRDARTLLRHLPGFANVVLLGVEFANEPPDPEASAINYSFRAVTYKRLLETARFRLAYMLEGVETQKAEKVAREIIAIQLDRLVGS